MLAVDTETAPIAPGRQYPRLICVSRCEEVGATLYGPSEGVDVVWRAMLDSRILVGANVAFDLGVMVEWVRHNRGVDEAFALLRDVFYHYARGLIIDVQHFAALRDIERADVQASYSLGELAKRLCGIELAGKDGGPDSWRTRFEELEGLAVEQWPEGAREYALEDARATMEVAKALHVRFGMPGMHVLTEQAAWALSLMSAWGVAIDPEAVARLVERVEGDVAAAELAARETGVCRADGSRDMAAIRKAIVEAFEARGEKPPKTATGKVQSDRKTLLATGHRGLVALAEAGESMTERSQWLDVLRDAGSGPLHGRYRVTVDSGRTSAFQPNWQNPPRRSGVRECVVARPGYLLCSVDWAAAELRTFAQELLDRFGTSQLAEAFRRGRDPHLVTAAAILGTTYEDCLTNRKRQDVKDARQLAKAANFGFPGGLGAESFCDFAEASYGVKLELEQARKLKAQWLDAYPEVRLYFDAIGKGGERQTLTHRRSGFVRGGVPFGAACNHFFQHPVAAAAKLALWWLAWECYLGLEHPLDNAPPLGQSPLMGCRPVLFLHDEVIVEVPTWKANGCARRIASIMQLALHKYCPDVPVEAEPALMRRWYKQAEKVERDGQLVPWEPPTE